ncbi:hypothetical protein DL767_007061 [Monosporascus sp. MG133]|nr:hypothetical protein DL767_007061 [Monosporascus sp. MG133]
MYGTFDIVFGLFLSIILLCQAGGAAFFAHFVHQELRAYFSGPGMESDVHTAQLVSAYLFMTTGFSIIYSISALLSICHRTVAEKKRISFCRFFGSILSLCIGITVIIFGIITAKATWSWWKYFEEHDRNHLAQITHGVTAMAITVLAMTACSVFSLVLFELAGCILKLMARSSKTKKTSTADQKECLTQEERKKDLEAQLQAVEAALKR